MRQLDIFRPQAHARHGDPDTSHAAAASVDKIRESQRRILELLRLHGPMTDAQIWARIPRDIMSLSGARTRRAELVDLGMVMDSGKRGRTTSGRGTIIWEAIP